MHIIHWYSRRNTIRAGYSSISSPSLCRCGKFRGHRRNYKEAVRIMENIQKSKEIEKEAREFVKQHKHLYK